MSKTYLGKKPQKLLSGTLRWIASKPKGKKRSARAIKKFRKLTRKVK